MMKGFYATTVSMLALASAVPAKAQQEQPPQNAPAAPQVPGRIVNDADPEQANIKPQADTVAPGDPVTPVADTPRPDGTGLQDGPGTSAVADATVAEDGGGEIVVTGSRIGTGFQAPTPVTISSTDDLKAAAPGNLADGLNTLPAFQGSARANQSVGGSAAGGANGQNLLNLRGLGAQRNLVLLDGRRLPATNALGSVDVNVIPQNLVSRVEVVTGGASAAYGSDAVAGVVNFILDTKFNGVRAEAQSGITTYGDARSFLGSLAFGRSFAGNRARIIASVEYATQDGIGYGRSGRGWAERPAGIVANPVAGARPALLVGDDVRSSIGSYGGLITAGPLRGTQFLPGGATAPFNYGSFTGTTFQIGGDGADPTGGLSPDQNRVTAFARAEGDVTGWLTLFAEGQYARARVVQQAFPSFQIGAQNQFTIFADNAFLPLAVRQRMAQAGVTQFSLGRYSRDLPLVVNDSLTRLRRGAVGGLGALGGSWKYDFSYSYGRVDQDLAQRNLTISRRLYAAADAVLSPTTGQIVCRSTLAGLDAGCVPINVFGDGSISAAGADYVTGDAVKALDITQQVAVANINGNLGERFQLGAGPISVAAGLEYRKEAARQTVDPLSLATTSFTGIRGGPAALNGRLGSYQFFNPQPLRGDYDIKEGYLEIGIPVLRDVPFFQSLEVNAVGRRADYSTAGVVYTWKVGATWQIVDAIRLRAARSRDVRGPNILELFNSVTQVTGNVIINGASRQITSFATGNAGLGAEKALTTTAGVVVRPPFIPGLQASIDYYSINIDDAIGALSAQQTVDNCAAGSAQACSLITTLPSGVVNIQLPQLNLNEIRVSGLDFEGIYTTSLGAGKLTLRGLANHTLRNDTLAPGAQRISFLGSTGRANLPRWIASLTANLDVGETSLFVQQRFIGAGRIDSNYVEGVNINDNHVKQVFYTNMTATQRFGAFGGNQELFLSVNNLFNRKPPVAPALPTNFQFPTNATLYDVLGRTITIGVRARF